MNVGLGLPYLIAAGVQHVNIYILHQDGRSALIKGTNMAISIILAPEFPKCIAEIRDSCAETSCLCCLVTSAMYIHQTLTAHFTPIWSRYWFSEPADVPLASTLIINCAVWWGWFNMAAQGWLFSYAQVFYSSYTTSAGNRVRNEWWHFYAAKCLIMIGIHFL